MEIRLLGPLEAVDADAPLPLGGTKQRALLAALTLAGGRVVSAARLVDDLWGDRPPDTAPKMVQIHVSALRKVLPADVLVTRAPGYAVDLPRDAIDAFRAEDALRAGRDALAAGDARGAAEVLAGALALWRGPALEEFGEPFAEGEARRLAELRLALTEERLAADLALGRHVDAIREIEALVSAQPLRERLRELQMVALYRSGRQAEALGVYQDAFRALNEELGIEPSARLRELERAVLRQDASLDPPTGAGATPGPVATPGMAPIGRDAELAALGAQLAAAAGGATRVVLVTGEAGAGKTTLVDALLDGLPEGAALVGRGQCVVQHGPSEAYMPVLQALERICRAPGAGDVLPALVARAPTWMAQLPWLLDDAARQVVETRLVGANRDRMLREGVEAITELSVARPVVLVVEDLQWSDLATVDLIAALALHRGPARLVVLATMRPPDAAPGDAIQGAARDLVARGLATEVAVGGLGDGAVARYLASRLPGADVPGELAASLRARTGGIPLFLEKAVDGWIEDGRAARDDGGWSLTADAAALSRDIPSTLRGLIRRRLDPLPPEDRRLLETASVAAPAFSAALVAAALDEPEADVEDRIDALARARVMLEPAGEERWPDGTVSGRYAFTHDLCHEVLYDDLPAGRRARLHLAVGDRLERAHPDGRGAPPAELAVHFQRGGEPARAVRHLVGAAERAAGRLAPREALALIEEALEAIRTIPPPERDAWELRAALLHGPAVVATSGWSAPAAEQSFERARELALELGRIDDAEWATYRLATLHEVTGDYPRSEELLRPMLAPGARPASGSLALDLQELMACTLFHQGEFSGALENAQRGLALERTAPDPLLAAAGDDAVTACHHWAALSALHLGRPEEAVRVSDQAIAMVAAPTRRHAAPSALALGAIVGQLLGQPARARSLAERAIDEAEERGYVYRTAMGRVLRGWSRAAQGDTDGGIAELREGIAQSHATGAHMDDAYYLGLLADAHLRAGDAASARAALDEARAVLPRDGRFFHEAELQRLRGEVAMLEGDTEAAERALRRARDVA
ncbi:MAG TPA: BTAD domain-containing putative transcriptional regulator, partial [Miltoncostaea sp.]|nr:BTAD domain-containing putative transcriptional regulator [Miltoncostaea sp.]